MSILGNAVVRREDPAFLTSGGDYVPDLDLTELGLGAPAYLVYVRSTVGHGRILEVDVDEARQAPGVLGVFAADDIAEMGTAPNVLPIFPEGMRRPFVAKDVAKGKAVTEVEPFIGSSHQALITPSRATAAAAAAQVGAGRAARCGRSSLRENGMTCT